MLSGRYRLVEPLGAGGFGEVWRGVDHRLERDVAVKVLLGSRDGGGQAARLFEREAKLAARLSHPGITVVHDVGVDSACRFVVMELLAGRDLAAVLDSSPGGVAVTDAADWGAQAADALAVAHRAGVVHRDIKPANLMLVDEGRIKVCDFGIARAVGATAGVTARGYASPAYAAPEQISDTAVDGRADLYSLGCTLYHLLTGSPPFTGDTHVAVLAGHLSRTPDLPSALRAEVPPALDDLLMALLAKDPAQRPGDPTALAARLRHLSAPPRPTRREEPRTAASPLSCAPRRGAVYLGALDWSTTAATFRGRDYETFTAVYPPGGTRHAGHVWGDGVYTDDSSVGLAAVHSGLVSLAEGGAVTFEIRPGQRAYGAASRNGVKSSRWGRWSGSFVFPEQTERGVLGRPKPQPVFVGPMDWSSTATAFRGRDHESFTFLLPPGGAHHAGHVWGDGVYTDDSSVGLAAVHSGLVSLAEGGAVTFEIRPGQRAYGAASRNGVKSSRWGRWSGSFVFR
ncbi:LCCL domain-containing protein [Streptomonospora nanhaiensis]|uniref:non-specific serine/threonine protein kinase n=1 Tax=Streptomonospora nanhaiensis TaxID=1323731 RepID=A0A853BI73_9ACTN|nr:LCCL domain-containing protein [Streptomonospora nanhaiensis]MBV2367209.1 protein kinase [Streptomonospora nanhaiensis]MBX9391131.1 protein kinase [Streptomonospora nanhaiensis]NYI95188.1 cold shock CspA family protein [Streptomonospora nanhaiensis]